MTTASEERAATVRRTVEELAGEFTKLHGVAPKQVRLGHYADLVHGSNLFESGDELAGLTVERDDSSSFIIEVGLWLN